MVGLVQLEEGPRLVAQICDTPYEVLKINLLVKAVFCKYNTSGADGIIYYRTKFVALDFA